MIFDVKYVENYARYGFDFYWGNHLCWGRM